MIPKRSHFFSGIIGSILLLNSCQLGQHYVQPDLHLPDRLDASRSDTNSIGDLKWWEIYTDTALQTLLKQTLAYNKDLKIATARIKEMAALKRIDLANLFPQLNGKVYGEKEATNYGGKSYEAGYEYQLAGVISWEVDLWGNLRWAKDKSKADFLGSIENERALRMSLIARVAQSYFELVALDNELDIVRQTAEARKESVQLAMKRFKGGLTSETPYRQAQVEYARTASLIPELERDISIKENELAVLTGAYPHRISRNASLQDIRLPENLPVGLPSTLLERRPDIRQSEQNLIAANAAVGIAYTNLFPRISLTATLGVESEELGQLLKSPYHLLVGNLLQPLFAMGKNRAALKAQKAAYEQAVYRYEKTVLNAFTEVRNAIVNYTKTNEIHKSRLRLERAAWSAIEKAQIQYINGYISYIDLLDAQRGYLDARIGLNKAVRDKQICMINLYKALGGGWQ